MSRQGWIRQHHLLWLGFVRNPFSKKPEKTLHTRMSFSRLSNGTSNYKTHELLIGYESTVILREILQSVKYQFAEKLGFVLRFVQ